MVNAEFRSAGFAKTGADLAKGSNFSEMNDYG